MNGNGKTDWRSWAIHAICTAVAIIEQGEDLTDEEYAAIEGDGDTGVELSFLEEAFNADGVPQRFTDFVHRLAEEGYRIACNEQAAKKGGAVR